MNDVEIIERLTKVEERTKNNTHQIEELKPVVEEIHSMSKAMVELIGEVKHTNESVQSIKTDVVELGDKVEAIEKEPAKAWINAKKIIFNTILGAIVGAIATGIIALIAQTI